MKTEAHRNGHDSGLRLLVRNERTQKNMEFAIGSWV